MIIEEENYLAHFGILRKSGRYPWGSGGSVATRSRSFLDYIKEMLGKGLTETEIAQGVGMSVADVRSTRTIARAELKASQIAQAQRLRDKGNSTQAISDRMGIPESTVRTLLAPGAAHKAESIRSTVEMLRKQVKEKEYIDVGSGVEGSLGISREKLQVALAILKDEGYSVHPIDIPQLGTGLDTRGKVLVAPGVSQRDLFLNKAKIQQIQDYSVDGGTTFLGIHPPLSINPKRVDVKFAEDGGAAMDGVIYVRPGVKDVSLGGSNYAQVRILVGKDRYLKGMAMYKEDLPPGIDLQFNTNKSKLKVPDPMDTLKEIKADQDNPFGTYLKRQITEVDSKGNEKVTSAMNIVQEEGGWTKWSKTLASQVLSKQSPQVAREQLDMAYEQRKADYDTIKSLTNPVLKKKLLESFADEADSAAVNLKAAKLPRQGWHAILPINSLKDNEVYAPNYKTGELVALIRYPHGGTFEIPELKVNNRNPEGKRLLGDAPDAVGINVKVAERLSGADFDGDTVLVIPNNRGKIRSTPALEGLKGFDPVASYPSYPGMKRMTPDLKGQEMGKISNLITDMTIRGASTADLARAVKHSMVVIDAEKHNLNFRESQTVNGIAQLRQKYVSEPTGGETTGASTIISRAGATKKVNQRKDRLQVDGGSIDPVTGRKIQVETNATFKGRDGQPVLKTQNIKRLADTDDAYTLISGTGKPMERLYASHSNRLKALANQARLESLSTTTKKFAPPASAKVAYKAELQSLDSKLALIQMRRPKERQAQVIANAQYSARVRASPDMDKESKKKIRFQAQEGARQRMGIGKAEKVDITPREWEAIQSGAVSNSKLKQILDKADLDQVKKYATPKSKLLMTSAKTTRAKAMLAAGYDRSEVADALGVSLSTLDEATV